MSSSALTRRSASSADPDPIRGVSITVSFIRLLLAFPDARDRDTGVVLGGPRTSGSFLILATASGNTGTLFSFSVLLRRAGDPDVWLFPVAAGANRLRRLSSYPTGRLYDAVRQPVLLLPGVFARHPGA